MSTPATTDAVSVNVQWPTAPALLRFSVADYHRMIEAGVLGEDHPVELLEGFVVKMAPIGPMHAVAVSLIYKRLGELITADWDVISQQPLTLEDSEPEPVVAVVRGNVRDYAAGHPSDGDVGLVVEVAEKSLNIDRRQKAAIYAAAGIAEYWIINLPERRAEIHRQPRAATDSSPAAYETREVVPADGRMSLVLEGKKLGEIGLSDVLP